MNEGEKKPVKPAKASTTAALLKTAEDARDGWKASFERCKATCEQVVAERDQLHTEKASLAAELEKCQADLTASEVARATAAAELDDIQGRLLDCQSRLENADNSLKFLQTELIQQAKAGEAALIGRSTELQELSDLYATACSNVETAEQSCDRWKTGFSVLALLTFVALLGIIALWPIH
jgi:predicted nuclease with TOPRIM domain